MNQLKAESKITLYGTRDVIMVPVVDQHWYHGWSSNIHTYTTEENELKVVDIRDSLGH
jgi:hypothetical protein